MVSPSPLAIASSLTCRSSRSLGSLGYNAKIDLSPSNFGRLLAVISRVYPKLHVRAAAYTLWGLSRMDIVWDDLLIERKSLVNGNNISPLSDGVYKYLKSRVASMKEHEYSVLMYSLGELKLNWNTNLPVIVKEKMFHRLTRVSNFITSRSLANLLYGKHSISLPPTHLPSPFHALSRIWQMRCGLVRHTRGVPTSNYRLNHGSKIRFLVKQRYYNDEQP